MINLVTRVMAHRVALSGAIGTNDIPVADKFISSPQIPNHQIIMNSTFMAGILSTMRIPTGPPDTLAHMVTIRNGLSPVEQFEEETFLPKDGISPMMVDFAFKSFNKSRCHMASKGGRVKVNPCDGLVHVYTTSGPMVLNCQDLPSHKFIGPVFLVTDECYSVADGLPICPVIPFDSQIGLYPCRDGLLWSTWAVIGIFFFLLVLEIVALRFYYVFYRMRLGDYRLTSMAKTDDGYVFNLTTLGEDNVRYTKAARSLGVESTIKTVKVLKLSKAKVALCIILFRNPFSMVESLKIPLAQTTTHQVLANAYSNVIIGDMKLQLSDVWNTYGTSQLYYTGSYSVKEWTLDKWTAKSCHEDPKCKGGANSPGVYSTSGNVTGAKPYTVHMQACMIRQLAGLLTPSCLVRQFDLVVDPGRVYSVHRLESSIPMASYHVVHDGMCTVSQVESLTPTSLPQRTLLKTPPGDWLICPHEDHSMSPISGGLGDIQVSSTGLFSKSPGLISCYPDHLGDMPCDVSKPSIDDLLTSCKVLPTSIGGVSYRMHNGVVQATASPAVKITVKCTGNPENLEGLGACGGLEASLQGIRDSPAGVTMTIRTKRVHSGAMWTGVVPCIESNLTVPCDGVGIRLMVTEGLSCLDEIGEVKRNIIESTNMGGMRTYHSTIQDHSGLSTDWMPSLSSFFSGSILTAFLASPAGILLIGFLLMRR